MDHTSVEKKCVLLNNRSSNVPSKKEWVSCVKYSNHIQTNTISDFAQSVFEKRALCDKTVFHLPYKKTLFNAVLMGFIKKM